MKTSLSVLVVGAGPTGLTLACELARSGVSMRIIDAQAGPQRGSRGKGVQPRTLEIFEGLGIIDRLLAHGRMAMPIEQIANGIASSPVNAAAALKGRPDIPYWASLITPQWRVEEALRLRLEELGGAVEFGRSLESFSQSDDHVTAIVGGERIRARWLVGCDGGHSTVRKLAAISFGGETNEDIRMMLADVDLDGLDRDAWRIWQNDEGMVTLCPLPSTDQFQFGASVAPGETPDLSLANMQALLERRSGRTEIRLRAAHWSSLWRANVRLVDRYRERRVFLAGDAAHIHAPAGGQGMNTGIQDAHNLGWKLAAVEKGAEVALLDTYDAERRPVAAGVLALSNTLLKQAIDTKDFASRPDASTLQLGVGYRGSSLAHDDRGDDATLRAGDRAPDGRTAGRRLFDLLRDGAPTFTVLCFGPRPDVDVKTLRVDELAHVYGATERTLVLIRPDGYIGVISDAGDTSVVRDYLERFGNPRSRGERPIDADASGEPGRA